MAFTIRVKDHAEASKVIEAVLSHLERSRFRLSGSSSFGNAGGIAFEGKGQRLFVAIRGIRLRIKKGYCGNHAGPCRLTGRKHKRADYLEGLDWVSWNDMLNDALDSIGHDGDVRSTTCILRWGRKRRIEYVSGTYGGEWDRDTEDRFYVDCIGKTPPETIYPYGTPGIIGWGVECVEAPYEEAAA